MQAKDVAGDVCQGWRMGGVGRSSDTVNDQSTLVRQVGSLARVQPARATLWSSICYAAFGQRSSVRISKVFPSHVVQAGSPNLTRLSI